MNDDRTQKETRRYAAGWMQRRIVRTTITMASLLAIALHRGGFDSWADQAALAAVAATFVFDLLHARRELARVGGGAPRRYLILADRELTYLKWAELTEYIAAVAIAIRLVHRSLDLFEHVAAVAFVAAGFLLRFGLGRSAKSTRNQLHFALQTHRTAF
jgi:hypothetical protein